MKKFLPILEDRKNLERPPEEKKMTGTLRDQIRKGKQQAGG